MKLRHAVQLSLAMVLFSILSGCGTLPNGKRWGEEATISPGWDRVGTAAYNSLVSPLTWAPAVGAAFVQIGNWDHKISRWASDRTPVFGSRENADNWSNYLLVASGAAYGATGLLTPSGEERGEWVADKIKGFIVGGAALGVAEASAVVLQRGVDRDRPDGDRHGFPSAHAAGAASLATLAAKNIETLQLPRGAEIASDIGLGLLATGSSWARVEAKKHYPSDMLAGMAIGHFFSAFVNDAFLGIDPKRGVAPEAEVSRKGFMVGVKGNF
jgi:hypothetical protein